MLFYDFIQLYQKFAFLCNQLMCERRTDERKVLITPMISSLNCFKNVLRERFLRPFQTFFFLFLPLNQKRFFYCKSSKSQHELPLIYVFKIQGQYRVPLISECRLFAVSYCNAAHDWRISSVHHPNRSRGRDTLENHITVDVRSRRKGAAEKT